MLVRLGKVTTPAGNAPEFHVARRWAWVRYCWAFADPVQGGALRLSSPAFELAYNRRQALSEDLGIAVALEATERHLLSGQPFGTTIEPVDVDEALRVGRVWGMAVGFVSGTRMRPDYLLVRTAPGQPQEIFALECKGTHSGPIGLNTLHKAAAQVRGLQLGPPGVPAGGAGWGAPDGLIGATSFDDQRIRLELFDPPGDERWNGEPAARERRSEEQPVAEVQPDGSARVHDPARFRRLLIDVSEARLLTLAGRGEAANGRLGRWPAGLGPARTPVRSQTHRDNDLGNFDGTRLRLPIDGPDVVDVFLGVERDVADAVQADDDEAKAAALARWRGRTGGGDDDANGILITRLAGEDALTIGLGDGILLHARSATE